MNEDPREGRASALRIQQAMRYQNLIAVALLHVLAADATAEDPATDAGSVVATFVHANCLECHDGDGAEGGLDLRRLPWKLESAESLRRWARIHDRIENREMPPDPETLSDASRAELLAVLADALHDADLSQVRLDGRGPMRRLTRGEFEHNLRDLLHLPDLDVRDILPEDREAHQTNKCAETLDVTRVQLAAYLDAADVALHQAVASGARPRPVERYRAPATNMFPKAIDHAGRESTFYAKNSKMVPLTSGDLARIRENDAHDPEMEVAIFRSATWPYYGYPEGFVARVQGRYRVRFLARAVRQIRDFRLVPSPDPRPMTFRARQPSLADVSGDVRATGGIIDVLPEPEVHATTVYLKRGETIEYSLLGLPVPFPITSHGGPLYYDFPPMPEGGHPGIAFRWIEITGPIDTGDWPPESHRALFGDLPIREAPGPDSRLPIEVVSDDPARDAKRLFRRFADDAARRPVPAATLESYERLILDRLEQGDPLAEALMAGYKAFLCSGHFLFLREPEQESDHYAIGSRLSHFLWNSRPDASLRATAEAGRLRDASILRAEVDRLIDDPRFRRFVIDFTDYWLDLKNVRRDAPDIRLYPEYRGDDYLVESMERQSRALIETMFRENLPATNLVQSDFAVLNDRLARHYELPPVRGSELRKVTLPPGSERGGLLTQAALLKVTANGTTTSPIVRGAWVADRILGDPPPPPPPGVANVEPDIRGATTIRQILERHSADPQCRQCHARFDAVGLALENFDVLGGWRDRYRSLEKGDEITGVDRAGHKYSYRVAAAVDPSGQLRDGTEFRDVVQLKSILADQPRRLARNVLRRLVTYSTGTPVRFSDRREIEAILDDCRANDYRLRDLLHRLIRSRIFVGQTGVEGRTESNEGDTT